MDEKKKADRERLLEMGQKKREKNRREAKSYRQGLRGRDIASTIVRLDAGTMNMVKELARLRRQSINAILSAIIEKDVRILNEKLKDYEQGTIDQKTVMKDLGVRDFSEFVIALVVRGIPLKPDEKEEYERIEALGDKEYEGDGS
jgi:hypothetical protein